MLRGKQTLREGGRTLSASEWLLDVLARPAAADKYKVFAIDDPEVLGLLDRSPGDGRYYSYRELEPVFEALQARAAEAERLEPQARSRFEAALVQLYERLLLYRQLRNTIELAGTEDFTEEIARYAAAAPAGLKAARGARSPAGGRAALERLNGYFERYRLISQAAYFAPLPPPAGKEPRQWATVGDGLLDVLRGEGLRPGVADYAAMAGAWSRQDAAGFNEALARTRALLGREQARASSWSGFEAAFNRAEPFYRGMILYVCALVLAFASWLVRPRELGKAAFAALLAAFAVHTAGLAARIVLQGRPPVTNLYSSAVFVGWGGVLGALILERRTRKGFGSVAAGVLGFCTLLVAQHLTGEGDTMEMMRAVLDSNFWLATHVVTITLGYSATLLAGLLAHIYILRGLLTPSLDKESRRVLGGAVHGVIRFALLLSFIGTVLGGIWADQSWGRFWGWDPKENGALLVVLWNAIILHCRQGGYVRERGLMAMAVFGDIITALSWFGVNMLGIGLHSYGFMDKAFYALAAFVASQLAVMALAALPPGDAPSPTTN